MTKSIDHDFWKYSIFDGIDIVFICVVLKDGKENNSESSSNSIVSRFGHWLKAFIPIFWTLDGILIDSIDDFKNDLSQI